MYIIIVIVIINMQVIFIIEILTSEEIMHVKMSMIVTS